MKKFRFQLETLRKVTQMKKEQAEAAYAEASRRLEEGRAVLQQLLEEMQQGQKDYASLSQEGKRVTVSRLQAFTQFFAWKRSQIEQQQRIILELKGEKQHRLQELTKVMTYLKSIEQLKEKRFQEYKEEMLHEEQKQLDEIGLQLSMRRDEAV